MKNIAILGIFSTAGCQTLQDIPELSCDCPHQVIDWDSSTTHLFRGADSKFYDVKNLSNLAKNVEVQCLPLYRLAHNLNIDTWGYEESGRHKSLTAKQVLFATNRDAIWTRHCCRIKQASLDYPILITESKRSKETVVIDGMHRLAKAFSLGADCIKAKQISPKMLREAEYKGSK